MKQDLRDLYACFEGTGKILEYTGFLIKVEGLK